MLSSLVNLPIVDTLLTIVWFIVALSILITGHELGHFWMARLCGVKVLRFSIGFGKRLWGWTDKKGTEFIIAAVPLGGYVKMLDERAEAVPAELRSQAFNNKTIGRRAAIVSAGPIANFVLALLFYWLINMLGQSVVRPVVGSVIPDSIVAQAGIRADEELKTIEGIPTKSWYDVGLILIDHEGNPRVNVEVAPLDSEIKQNRVLDLSDWRLSGDESPIRSLGIIPFNGGFELNITLVTPDSAAFRAGLQAGDQIVSVNGKDLDSPMGFVGQIQQSPELPLQLEIKRGGEILTTVLTPDRRLKDDGEVQGNAGFALEVKPLPLPDKYIATIQYGPIEAMYQAGKQTWQITALVVKEVGRLVSGNRELSSLAGPVTIAKGAGKSAEGGLVSYLGFLAIISLNLGIINLFPLPVLDGGHLLFLAVEKITGRPISERVQDYCYRIGIIILIMLMGLAFFNDFSYP